MPSRRNLHRLLPVVLAGLVAGFSGAWLAEVEHERWLSTGEVQVQNPEIMGDTAVIALRSPTTWTAVAEAEGYTADSFSESLEVEAVGAGNVIRVQFASDDKQQAIRVVDATMASFIKRESPAGVDKQHAVITSHLEMLQERRSELQLALAAEENVFVADTKLSRLNALTGSIVDAELLRDQTDESHAAAVDKQPAVLSEATIENHQNSANRLLTSLVAAVVGVSVALLLVGFVDQRLVRVATSGRTSLAAPPNIKLDGYSALGNIAQRALKRGLDVTVASFGLVLLSPLFLGLALSVKFTSKGPVFFRQERVGFRGTPFQIIKFRTMSVENDDSAHKAYIKQMMAAPSETSAGGLPFEQASSDHPDQSTQTGGIYKLDDPRVTRVGLFLRSYSLDELPQLWNVVKGDMSLIGPRPSLPWEHEIYGATHQQRVRAKPGCSGLWQVSGHNKLTVPEMLDLDLEYLNQWNARLDLKILLRTPATILGRGSTR